MRLGYLAGLANGVLAVFANPLQPTRTSSVTVAPEPVAPFTTAPECQTEYYTNQGGQTVSTGGRCLVPTVTNGLTVDEGVQTPYPFTAPSVSSTAPAITPASPQPTGAPSSPGSARQCLDEFTTNGGLGSATAVSGLIDCVGTLAEKDVTQGVVNGVKRIEKPLKIGGGLIVGYEAVKDIAILATGIYTAYNMRKIRQSGGMGR